MSVDEFSLVALKDVLKEEVPFQIEILSHTERAAVWNHRHTVLGPSHLHKAPFGLRRPFLRLGMPHFRQTTGDGDTVDVGTLNARVPQAKHPHFLRT